MKPLELSVNKPALELHLPAARIGEIVHERRRITAETAHAGTSYFQRGREPQLLIHASQAGRPPQMVGSPLASRRSLSSVSDSIPAANERQSIKLS
jgi:hypothetical protein